MVKICVRYKNYYFQCELHLFNFESDFVQFLAAGDPNISPNPHGNKISAISALSAGPLKIHDSVGQKIKKFSGI